MTSNLLVSSAGMMPSRAVLTNPDLHAHLFGDHLGEIHIKADVLALLVGHLEGLIAGVEADSQHAAFEHGIEGGGRGRVGAAVAIPQNSRVERISF